MDKQKKLELKLELYEQEHIKTLQKKNKIKNEQHTMREKLELISKHSEEDLKRCEHFEYLLNEEYLKEIKERERVFYETSDNCDALLQLFSFVELKHHREDLMALSKQNIH